jgi:hypothetical protein
MRWRSRRRSAIARGSIERALHGLVPMPPLDGASHARSLVIGDWAALEHRIDLPAVGPIALYGLVGAFAAISELVERRIVSRRQSLADLGDMAVDDAIRATSIRVVAGAGIALLIQFAGPLVAITLAAGIPGEVGAVVAG